MRFWTKSLAQAPQLSKPTLLTSTVVLIATLGTSSITTADTYYKWKNDQGVWTYGEHPPQGVETVVVNTTSSKRSSQPAASAFDDSGANVEGNTGENDTSGNEYFVTQEAKVPKAEKIRLCKAAKSNLETLDSSAVIRKRDADGNVTVISDKERQTEIDNAKQTIKDFC